MAEIQQLAQMEEVGWRARPAEDGTTPSARDALDGGLAKAGTALDGQRTLGVLEDSLD